MKGPPVAPVSPAPGGGEAWGGTRETLEVEGVSRPREGLGTEGARGV